MSAFWLGFWAGVAAALLAELLTSLLLVAWIVWAARDRDAVTRRRAG